MGNCVANGEVNAYYIISIVFYRSDKKVGLSNCIYFILILDYCEQIVLNSNDLTMLYAFKCR